MEQISEQRLFRPCEILFGTELTVSRQFLDYLQLGGIKSAYRKRALETHPDLFAGRGQQVLGRNTKEFHVVREAYETLLSFVQTKKRHGTIIFPETYGQTAGHPEKDEVPRHRSASCRFTGNGNGPHAFRQGKIKPFILPGDIQKGAGYTNTEHLYHGTLPRRTCFSAISSIFQVWPTGGPSPGSSAYFPSIRSGY